MYLLSNRWYKICSNEANLNTLSRGTSLCIYCFHWPLCLWPRVGRDSRIEFRDLTSFLMKTSRVPQFFIEKLTLHRIYKDVGRSFLCSLPKKYYWWPWCITGCHKWQFSCERWILSSTVGIGVNVIINNANIS